MAATIESSSKSSYSQPKPVEFTSWPVFDEGLRSLWMMGTIASVTGAVYVVVGVGGWPDRCGAHVPGRLAFLPADAD